MPFCRPASWAPAAVPILLLSGALAPARAASADLCTDRPGLTSAACTIGAGRVQVETALIEHETSVEEGGRTLSLALGGSVLRLGLRDDSEIRLRWTPWQRTITPARSGGRRAASGTGDLAVAFTRRLTPAEDDFALALVPEITLPIGSSPSSQHGWSAALRVPIERELGDKWQLSITPEIDAAANEADAGRHLALGTAIGIDYSVSDALAVGAGASFVRHDAAASYTDARLGLALALHAGADSQIDVDGQFGLNSTTPRHLLSLGYVRRF